MDHPHFSDDALEAVEMLLADFACGDDAKSSKPRTAKQQAADQARSQKMKGRNTMSPSQRSSAAKKAAQTRKNCGGSFFPKG